MSCKDYYLFFDIAAELRHQEAKKIENEIVDSFRVKQSDMYGLYLTSLDQSTETKHSRTELPVSPRKGHSKIVKTSKDDLDEFVGIQ